MKKIQNLGKRLTKTEQRIIYGGLRDVQCTISGGCTCPNGSTYNPESACTSCEDIEGGYRCNRGNTSFEVTCENTRTANCQSYA